MPLRRTRRLVSPPIANVIIVEGSRREQRYFEQATKLSDPQKARWTVVSANGGDPGLILRKIREQLPDADRVFAVFDADRMPPSCSRVEAHAWKTLLEFAKNRPDEVVLIRSYPSIEVWFLWHFTEDLPQPESIRPGEYTSQAGKYKSALRTYAPQLDERPLDDWRLLNAGLQQACQRSRRSMTATVQPRVWSEIHILMKELGLD